MRENRNRAIEILRGARLIDADLSRAQAAANICLEKKYCYSDDAPTYRGKMATVLWHHCSRVIEQRLGCGETPGLGGRESKDGPKHMYRNWSNHNS